MGFVAYETPISQEDYPKAALTGLIVGFFLLAYFFIYQIAYKRHERSLKTEVILSFLASALLSVGITFLFLTVGIYL